MLLFENAFKRTVKVEVFDFSHITTTMYYSFFILSFMDKMFSQL